MGECNHKKITGTPYRCNWCEIDRLQSVIKILSVGRTKEETDNLIKLVGLADDSVLQIMKHDLDEYKSENAALRREVDELKAMLKKTIDGSEKEIATARELLGTANYYIEYAGKSVDSCADAKCGKCPQCLKYKIRQFLSDPQGDGKAESDAIRGKTF